MSVIDPTDLSTHTLRMTSIDAIGGTSTQIDGYEWEPVITEWPERTVELMSGGDFAPATIDHGSIAFSLHQHPSCARYVWSGALARVWISEEGAGLVQWFEGAVSGLEMNGDVATVRLLGNEANLAIEILTAIYAGTGGAEGPAGVRGNRKPWASGECSNVEPVCLYDGQYWFYQYHGYGPTAGARAVFENALELAAPKARVSSLAAAIALAPQPGEWIDIPGQGGFLLGAEPTGKITADVGGAKRGSEYPATVDAIARHLIEAAGVPNARVNLNSFSPLTGAWSHYVTVETTIGDIIRQALFERGAYLITDAAGVFCAGDFFSMKPAVDLFVDGSSERLVVNRPALKLAPTIAHSVRIGHTKVWATHSLAEISPALTVISEDIAAANLAAESARTAANQALADAAFVVAQIDELAADNILDRAEKKRLERIYADALSERTALVNQSNAFAIVAERNAFTAALDALTAFLNGLSPAWSNTSVSTPISRTDFDSAWTNWTTARVNLTNKIAEVAATKANWPNVTGPGRPQDGATVGAIVGDNLVDSNDNILTDADIITSEGTSANTEAVGSKTAVQVVNQIDNAIYQLDDILATRLPALQNDYQLAIDAATQAENEAAAAEVAKLAAENAKIAAAGAATASAGSADIASAKSIEAGDFASAANASKLEAAVSRDDAANSASIATAKAVTATDAATTATTQANLSASYVANIQNLQQRNRSFDFGLEGWVSNVNGSGDFTSEITTTSAFEGGNYLMSPSSVGQQAIFSKATFPVDTTRKYRFRTIIAAYGDPAGKSTFWVGFVGLDAAGNPVNHGSYGSYRYACTNGFRTINHSERLELEAVVTGEGNDSWLKFPPGAKQVRLVALTNYSPSLNSNAYLGLLDFEDVTESQAAKAQADIATTQSTNATAQAAAAERSAVLSANVSTGALNANSRFASWTGSTLNNWVGWVFGGTNSKAAGQYPGSDALRMTNPNQTDHGWLIEGIGAGASNLGMKRPAPGWYALTAKVKLVSGSLRGAGVLLYTVNDAGAYLYEPGRMNFETYPDASGSAVGLGTVDRTYTFTRFIYCNPADVANGNFRLYAMNGWGDFSSLNAAKTLDWHECSIRPATEAEVLTNTVLPEAEAATKRAEGAIATLNGKSSAYTQLEVNAGSETAFAIVKADSFQPAATPVTLVKVPGSLDPRIEGRSVEKVTGGAASWDNAVKSLESYAGGCYVSGSPANKTSWSMLQLSDAPDANASYLANNYSIYFSNGSLILYEGPSAVNTGASYETTDVFAIEYKDSTVKYLKNGKVFRTVTTTAGRNFCARVALHSIGAKINNIVFSSQGPVTNSNVSFGANEFHVFNPADGGYKKALSVIGGNAILSGGLLAGTFIKLGNGQGWDVALASKAFDCIDGTVVSFGTSLPNSPIIQFPATGLDALGTGETYNLYADNVTNSGFTARLKIITPGTSTPKTQGGAVTSGTGPGYQMTKTDGTLSTFGNYTFRVYVQVPSVQPYNAEPIPGGTAMCDYWASVTVGLWVKRSGVWTKVQSTTGVIETSMTVGQPYARTLSKTVDQTVNLGTSAIEAFGVSYESASVKTQTSGGIVAATGTVYGFPQVAWVVNSSSTQRSATSSNIPVKIMVIPQ